MGLNHSIITATFRVVSGCRAFFSRYILTDVLSQGTGSALLLGGDPRARHQRPDGVWRMGAAAVREQAAVVQLAGGVRVLREDAGRGERLEGDREDIRP